METKVLITGFSGGIGSLISKKLLERNCHITGISRTIDRGMDLEAAVAAPRVHPSQGTDPDTGGRTFDRMSFSAEFTPENGWTSADSTFWANAGFKVQAIKRYGAFSRVHAISRDPKTGIWTGMADLDWEGTAEAPSKSICNK